MNLAIISPSQNAYSETFIQAHKKLIGFNNFYYHGYKVYEGDNISPQFLEGYGEVSPKKLTVPARIAQKLRKSLGIRVVNRLEEAFAASLLSNKIDAVLAEFGTTGAGVTAICKKLNLPLFVYFHGFDAHKYEILRDYKESYERMFSYASAVFVVSQVMLKQIISLGCDPKKIVLNTYGPNDEFFEINPTFRSKKVMAIGRFVDKKAPYLTLLAFKKTLKEHPDAELYFAGEGELYNTCLNLVKYFRIESSVIFLGAIDVATFKRHLEDSTVFVQHSVIALNGDSEGTPVAILEAQAAGLPVVSTMHAGIQDVVVNGKTGFLVEECDVDAMAERMSYLLANIDTARVMGAEGKKRIAAHYSMKQHIQKIEEVISEKVPLANHSY